MYGGSEYWFITARCAHARKLMSPDVPLIREVCGGVLARSARIHRVGIFGYVFMSNHLHLAIRARGKAVANFLRHLMGNLSLKLARLSPEPWRNSFWETRTSVIAILDLAALKERLRYIAAHAVKEGIFERAEQWPGLHCAQQLVDRKPLSFKWFGWTRRWNSRKRQDFDLESTSDRFADEWAEVEKLTLEDLPEWSALEEPQRRETVQAFVDHAAHYPRRKALGYEGFKLSASAVYPTHRKVQQQPRCHASSREDRKAYREQYRAFCEAFRAAAMAWLEGDLDAQFPEHSFRPYLPTEEQII